MQRVVIIDYGMGNLCSVKRAFEQCRVDVAIAEEPATLATADRIVLPGVGAFADGMAQLREKGWIPALYQTVLGDRVPLLGICLGMQLLFEKSFEGGETEGLGLISGEIVRFQPTQKVERVPHVGWNQVDHVQPSALLEGIASGTDFYFVHSYHAQGVNEEDVLATTPYCGVFPSVVAKNNIFGAQFHPEKSALPGLQLLTNFLACHA